MYCRYTEPYSFKFNVSLYSFLSIKYDNLLNQNLMNAVLFISTMNPLKYTGLLRTESCLISGTFLWILKICAPHPNKAFRAQGTLTC